MFITAFYSNFFIIKINVIVLLYNLLFMKHNINQDEHDVIQVYTNQPFCKGLLSSLECLICLCS